MARNSIQKMSLMPKRVEGDYGGAFAGCDKLYKLGIEAATDAARASAMRGEET